MKKSVFVSSIAVLGTGMLLLAGCGLAEVGASAATEGASAAEQAKEGKKIEQQVQQRVDDAQAAERKARDDAEQASQ